MLVRIAIAAAALSLAAGCTGDGREAVSSGGPDEARAARRAVADFADPELQRAQIQAGSDAESGALARFCAKGRCSSDPGAVPERFMDVPDSGLVLFVVAQVPNRTRVKVLERRSGEQVLRRILRGATVMPLKANLDAGSYLVRLRAVWDEQEATWVFGVRVRP